MFFFIDYGFSSVLEEYMHSRLNTVCVCMKKTVIYLIQMSGRHVKTVSWIMFYCLLENIEISRLQPENETWP